MMPAGKGLSDLIEKWGGEPTNERRSGDATASAPAASAAGRPPTRPPPAARAFPGSGEHTATSWW